MKYNRIGLFTEDRLPLLKAKPAIFWIASFAICVTISGIIALDQSKSLPYFALCAVLAAASLIFVPFALHICRAMFLSWARSANNFIRTADEEEIASWYNAEVAFFEGSWATLIAGLGMGLIGYISY